MIAFYSERDRNAEIYVINADGTGERRLTNNNADDVTPDWSPDGEQIAFGSTVDNNGDIYIMKADGSDQRRLTHHEAEELHPDWSPDGRRIAFVSDRDGDMEIYVMDIDGANQVRLTYSPAGDMSPDWSPDGTQIIFNSERDGNWEIYVMDSDGANQRPLTESPEWEIFPAWSPDGTKITYFSMIPGGRRQDVFTMNADGTGVLQLTDRPNTVDEDPVWSPDGSQIAFQSDRDRNFEIYVMNADGSNQRRLTNSAAGEYWPAWRPESWFHLEEEPDNPSTIFAPQGAPATIDGVISQGEWDSALPIDLANGELLLMHADGYLYVGIRSDRLGLGSICVLADDEISVLHSSAALGTATYEKAGDEWLKIRDFLWTNREVSSSTQALEERTDHLERENWLASNGLTGRYNEMEYQIEMTDDEVRLAVTYLMSPDYETTDFWPDTLGTGCRNFEPLQSDAPEAVLFAPETWMTVIASNS
jgi:TolB protein